jgi:exodeoxyribonuclease VII small subunit
MAKGQTLEQSFEKLEEIIGRLGDDSISLDEAFKIYKEGVKLIGTCNQQLDKVEKQIVILEEQEDYQNGI